MNILSLETVIFDIENVSKDTVFLDLSSGVLRSVTDLWGGFLLMIKYIDCFVVN